MYQREDNNRGGDVVDHETLFERFCLPIFSYIRAQTASREAAVDVILDVFAAALENPFLPAWSGEKQLAWLKCVAHNKLVSCYGQTANTMLS